AGESGGRPCPPRPRGRAGRPPSPARHEGCSYLDHHREDHRAALGAVVDQLAEPVVQVLLQELDLGHVVLHQLVQYALSLFTHLLEQRLARLGEAAGDQLRPAGDGAVAASERRDDDQHAVFRQMPPVAQSDVLHVADAEAVHEGHARLDLTGQVGARLVQLDDRAVLGQHDPVLRDAAVGGKPCMGGEHPELPVHRHDRLRPHEPEHRPQLLGVAVARVVHRGDLLVQHLGAVLGELVDRVVHGELVPGDRLGRDDHGVARLDRDVAVVAVRDPHERRQRLALAAGAEDQHVAAGVVVELLRLDQRVVGNVDVAEVPRDVDVLAHRAADHAHLAAGLDRHVGRLLHAVDVRGERRDEDAAGARRNQLAEGLADEPLRAGHAGALGVRRVAEEQVDAAVAEIGQTADVGAEAVDRRVVHLVVAGVQDPAARRVEHDRDGIGDRVGDPHELGGERPELCRRALGVGFAQLRGAQQAVLVELGLDQPQRQPGRPDLLHARLAQQVGQRAHVILVAVRQQHRADRPVTVDQVRKVGEDQVDAEMLVTGERKARVDDDGLAVGLDHGHILAHLAEAAERDDLGAARHRPSVGQRAGLTGSRVEPDRRLMRLSLLAYATVAAGLGVTVAGGFAAAGRPLTALALFTAAALAAELLEEPESARIREPVGPGVFRVASGVDLAAVIVLGPWRGALVAGSAALLARLVRGSWRQAAFEASAFALASVAAGYGYTLGGGTIGHLHLPDDLVPLVVLALLYLLVSRLLLQVVGGLEVLQPDFAAAAAEAGLGAILALFALNHPWNVIAVVPVALAVNHAHARVRRSRQETLHALETFANIVDERDTSTYRHSLRVAGYVDQLARALGLPYSDIDRLRWAARLHDL